MEALPETFLILSLSLGNLGTHVGYLSLSLDLIVYKTSPSLG